VPIEINYKIAYDAIANFTVKLDKAVKDPALEQSVNHAVLNLAEAFAKKIRSQLMRYGPHKGGRWSYRRFKPYWTPSPPGQPPARITSALLHSIKVDSTGMPSQTGGIRRGGGYQINYVGGGSELMPRTFKMGDTGYRAKTYYVQVGSGLNYAGWQEFGNSRIPPRPFIEPAFRELLTTSWLTHVQAAVEGAIKGTTGFEVRSRRSSKSGWQEGLALLDMRDIEVARARVRNLTQRIARGGVRTGRQERQTRRLIYEGRVHYENPDERQAYMDYGGEFDY
jgi:hypothetical protein